MSNKAPLKDSDLLILKGDSYDPQELIEVLKPLGLTAWITTRFALMSFEFKKLFAEKGITYIWRLAELREAVLPAGAEKRTGLLKLLEDMLTNLSPSEEFVIVDPYLLKKDKNNSEYPKELSSLLVFMALKVKKLVLVVSDRPDKFDQSLFEEVRDGLSKEVPGCELILSRSGKYHDRFWIVDQKRGLFVGTSLNGIGRHYSLVDFLDPNDCLEIVSDLKKDGLI